MKQSFISLFGLLFWLAGVGLMVVSLASETLVANWPIIYAILGVGLTLYALLWTGLENILRQREEQHEETRRALLAIGKALQKRD